MLVMGLADAQRTANAHFTAFYACYRMLLMLRRKNV